MRTKVEAKRKKSKYACLIDRCDEKIRTILFIVRGHRCEYCGKIPPSFDEDKMVAKGLDLHHIFGKSRGHLHTRWLPINGILLDMGHHKTRNDIAAHSTNPEAQRKFNEWIREKYLGIERYELLNKVWKETQKVRTHNLEEVKKFLHKWMKLLQEDDSRSWIDKNYNQFYDVLYRYFDIPKKLWK